ncbi:arginyltransferase NDAI_0D03600 [Naumovozyma dairenensis CBS 421]|uniref:arginyltransferase n=1 Tax=Naumovozyma dairenensis (strain ATCC 10597 / BCRC 20456 / CBS 421 / NBRC 0211 / NRRL Y-12639) TaxID=1071378 RepID=G0WA63_NAUDC|nr:hypothetical protein NDAI_0D03600 [Naumovozyma dairenensis CBS 421]CCD24674.1 hypothetical protein NDAI_0D03600 [Naumovozyma dairenensis CBS 421]
MDPGISDRLIITAPMYFSHPAEDCGYCKGEKKDPRYFFALESFFEKYRTDVLKDKLQIEHSSIGFQAMKMNVRQYERLCNLGFRRSGDFIYRTEMLRNCCRLYTIRTSLKQFKITKEFKSAINKFTKRITTTEQLEKLRKKSEANKNKPYDFIEKLNEAEMISTNFQTVYEPAVFSEEKYLLFARYQEAVHKDFDHSPKGFERFLCHCPFTNTGTEEQWKQLNEARIHDIRIASQKEVSGPVHECYYYDDKLIALSVLDILPTGISSVYFIWDPDYRDWSLGKISALRELALVERESKKYYYLGLYADDCPKMNYKGAYGGELLDICNGKFVPLEFLKVNGMISESKFFTINDDSMRNGDIYIEDEINLPFPSCVDKREPSLRAALPENIETTNTKDFDINRAEVVYGVDGSAYGGIEELVKLFAEQDIEYTIEPSNVLNLVPKDEYIEQSARYALFPSVSPGLMPLWQLMYFMEHEGGNRIDGVFAELLVVEFSPFTGIRRLENILDESKQVKTAVCNLIRILGPSFAAEVLLVCQ